MTGESRWDEHQEGPAWWDAWRGVYFASGKVLKATEPELIERTGISFIWLDILARLADTPGGRPLRMQELQEASLFTRSGMTRIVDRMEREGLVRRDRVPGDRRGVFVSLTVKGHERYAEAMDIHFASIEREFGSKLTDEQHDAVAGALHSFWHETPGDSGAPGE